MYNYIYIYHLGIHTCIYTQCMHTYIYIVYMPHIYIYMHIYTCTHCMVTTTPHAATLLHQSSNTHTALYIYTCSSYKHTTQTHTHTLCQYLCTQCTKPLQLLGINRASTKVCRPCACPASTPFEHASSDRYDCRLTGLAPPRYPCPASIPSLLQSYNTYICYITHISCSVTTLSWHADKIHQEQSINS